jgi:hypothetical protein
MQGSQEYSRLKSGHGHKLNPPAWWEIWHHRIQQYSEFWNPANRFKLVRGTVKSRIKHVYKLQRYEKPEPRGKNRLQHRRTLKEYLRLLPWIGLGNQASEWCEHTAPIIVKKTLEKLLPVWFSLRPGKITLTMVLFIAPTTNHSKNQQTSSHLSGSQFWLLLTLGTCAHLKV